MNLRMTMTSAWAAMGASREAWKAVHDARTRSAPAAPTRVRLDDVTNPPPPTGDTLFSWLSAGEPAGEG